MEYTSIPGQELALRTRWYITMRWFVLLAVIVASVISMVPGSGWGDETRTGALIGVFALATNAVFFALGRVKAGNRYYRGLALSLLVFDMLFITYFMYIEGGIASREPILYVLPILMSATMLGRRVVYLTALMASTAYSALLVTDYLEISANTGGRTTIHDSFSYLINSIVFFVAMFFIVAALSDFITRLLIQKERQAYANTEALKRAQEMAKLGSWEWDIRSDTMKWSDEFLRIFGVEQTGQLDYDGYLRLVHPEDREQVGMIIGRALKMGKAFSFNHRVVRPDESVGIIHGEGKVIMAADGRALKMLGTGQDITAERELEEAKGDFVALASHQLRTPATGVKMLLAMVLEGYDGKLNAGQRKTLLQAYEANDRQLKIANDLLNVAKLESGRLILQRQYIDVAVLVNTIVTSHKLVFSEKQQHILVELPKEPVMMSADAERLSMAIDNLLSNAIKYTPAKGTVTVSLIATKTSVRIAVADTGIGISPTETAKLFHKFIRLDNQASRGVEGSGLGLYLVKRIVDLHRGTVRVRSRTGAGTKFTIRLPRTTLTSKSSGTTP